MTTGSVVSDNRLTTPTGCGEQSLHGLFYSKNWTGSDSLDMSKRSENPYSMALTSENDSLIVWSHNTIQPELLRSGTPLSCGFAPKLLFPTWDSNLDLELYSKALERMRGHSFNTAVSLGEARESITMIAQTARSLALSFSSLKRLDVIGAVKHLGLRPRSSLVTDVGREARRSASSAWLSLTYGWTPLVRDAANAAEALAANHAKAFKLRVSATRSIDGSVTGVGGGFTATGQAYASKRLLLKVSRRESLLSELGFTRPETLMWELLPFSFVADWFIPIGTYLEVMTSLRGLDGYAITSTKYSGQASMGSSPYYTIHSGSSTRKEVYFNRSVSSISATNLPLPRIKNPLSVSHATSAIALLQTVFGK